MKRFITISLFLSISLASISQSNSENSKINEYNQSAINAYNNEKYEEALYYFEKSLKISNKYYCEDAVVYNAGLSAFKCERWADAEKYFKLSINNKYGDGSSVYFLSQVYIQTGQNNKVLENLVSGYDIFPKNESILVELINYLISNNQSKQALFYINKAIVINPSNADYYCARGRANDGLKNYEDALSDYENCLKIDFNNYTALFNIGVIFYNLGIEKFNKANEIVDNEIYKRESFKANDFFILALPYLERCAIQTPRDNDLLQSLKTIFLRLYQQDSRYETYYNELKNRLEKSSIYYTDYKPHEIIRTSANSYESNNYQSTKSSSGTKTIIKMTDEGGVNTIPCIVNGLKMKFIFDTGASNVCISLAEAIFMIKNDYLNENDITGSSYSQIANGDIVENTEIILKRIEIGGITLFNVKASVIHNQNAPLLLGNSAIRKLGKIQIDGNNLIVLH